MNKLQVFSNSKFGEVRTIEENGAILFCGSDVAKALGYSDAPKAIKQHCKEDGWAFYPVIDSVGREQKAKFINEGNLYRLIVNSKLPSAQEFESWVFDEVLPSIHKHGAYMTPKKIDELLTDPDTIIQLATQLKNERAKLRAAEGEKLLLEQRVSEYEPKIQYLDQILKCKGTMAITQIAADYGLTAYQLNKILFEEHIQRKVGDQWVLYAEHFNKGYTKSETIQIMRQNGTPDTRMHTKWTQKGRLKIHDILERRGIKANIDKDQEELG